MHTDEITRILKHLLANSRARFLGVFASDILPPLKSIQSLVPSCNVSKMYPTGKGGTNWVIFSQSRQYWLQFLDRYGREPYEFGFRFPKCLLIFHNRYQIQAFWTHVCGHFCIFIVYHRAHNYSLHSICKKFSTLPYFVSASIVSSIIHKFEERINMKWMMKCERHEGNKGLLLGGHIEKKSDLC